MTKERPILFSTPMVQALLAGRKTQTRRVLKKADPATALGVAMRPEFSERTGKWHWSTPKDSSPIVASSGFACPYGVPGDRLWVREATVIIPTGPTLVGYIADGCRKTEAHERTRPSIHMPRGWCRLVLEIVSVRAERVQSISEAEAIAEGCTHRHCGGMHCGAGDSFYQVWSKINGKDSWTKNPIVWVIEFKVIGGGK